jgi:tripartite-type tricarboxylate transporter receptor subunit TctC
MHAAKGWMLAGALVAALAAPAAAWPERPIKVVVPFGPGGTSDQVARNYQAAIQEAGLLPQPINIVNVGGHLTVGARQVKDAAPDGYTFLVLHIALMGAEAAGLADFGWRDFAAVAATGNVCLLPVVRKDSGLDTVDQLLAKARAEPDTLLFGVNLGAINHLAGLMIQESEPGARFRFVQIGGGSANFAALTGKQTQVGVLSTAEVMSFTRKPDGSDNPDSQVKPLAYTGPERFARLPEIPTLRELGRNVEFCVDNWWFAPKGTPAEAVRGMAEALRKAQASERVKRFEESQGFASIFVSGAELEARLASTYAAIEPVAKLAAQKR